MNIFLIYPLIISFFIALVVTPLVIKLYWKLGWVEDPKLKKQPKVIHTYPVPRGGGIPIIISLVIASLLFLPIDKHLLGIIGGAILAVFIGILDDRFDLSPYPRMVTCVLSALFVVAAGIGIAYITNPLGGIINLDQPRINFNFLNGAHSVWVLSDLLAIVWIVACMNVINWSSGLDGQISGVVPIAALTIAALSVQFNGDVTQWNVAVLAVICAGAYLGFLPFHIFPQKIMPGYGGTTLAGFLLAVLAILSGAKLATTILVLGIPVADALWAIIRRVATGHSPFFGDRGHLHHKLLDMGWSKRKVALFYWLITFFLGILALNLNSSQKFYTIIMLIAVIGLILLWLNSLKASSLPPGQPNG